MLNRCVLYSLQVGEAFEGDFAGSGDELQELGFLGLIEGADCTPPPLDDGVTGRVAVQFGVVLPCVDVDIGVDRR